MPTTNLNKLTTLEQLKLLATRVHAEDQALGARIDQVVQDIEGLITAGGEPNVLEGVKVNGAALDIADKMVDILIASGEENGTISVNGAAVAVKGLQALAYKANVSEADLDEALKAVIAAKATNADLEALEVRVQTAEGEIATIKGANYQTGAQVEAAIQAAIAATGHAHFEKVDAVPTVDTAEENVLYLVMNGTTGHYDIYALVSGAVELIDDTTVDLTAYSTTEQMNAAIQAAVTALNIGDYAKAADLLAAVDRIAALETKFNSYSTTEQMNAAIKAVDDKFAGYSTTEQVNAAIGGVDAKFANYTNTEGMNAAIKAVDDKFAGYSTTEQVNAAIGGVDAKFANYSTTEEMNSTLAGYATDEEAAAAAEEAVAAAIATDEEVAAALDEIFGE